MVLYKDRKFRITASSARSQYTYYINRNADWDKRVRDLSRGTFKGNNDTINGLKYEGTAREKYEDLNGCKVLETGLIVHPEIPW